MSIAMSRDNGAGLRIVSVARSAEAASINLINAVDGTVDALSGLANVMTGFNRMIISICDEIAAQAPEEGCYLDQNDEAVDALGHAADSLKDLLTNLVRKRAGIDKDRRLEGHHCESLHDAYEGAIEAVAELVEACAQMRAAIIRHDLAAEPRNGPAFTTVESLIESLRNA